MAIDKKLIHFKNWNNFISQGVGSEENITIPTSGTEDEGTAIYGQIKGTSIVFIKDLQKIWTHGQLYSCSDPDLSNFVTKEELEELEKLSAPMISVTYNELKTLRDNSQLILGQQYRITDYVTTTSQAETQSAGHQFDVIVTADNENTLNEVARACLHEGDTYFSEADANLAAWKIWYCLDNDTSRFAWADTENGKGVIYRMIDEWNNDIPYDFKNIFYEIPKKINAEMQRYGEWFSASLERDSENDIVFEDTKYYAWYLMITSGPSGNATIYTIDEDADGLIFYDISNGNVTESTIVRITSVTPPVYQYTFRGENQDSDETDGTLHFNCCDNQIRAYVKQTLQTINFITFGSGCSSNSFGDDCYYNSLGNECHSNSFGSGCHSNSLGNYCSSNSFRNDCYSNSFGNYCYNTSFGNGCLYNSFRNDCYYNSFGNDCGNNSFGNGCLYNSFRNDCYYNSFGNDCNYNSFGNECNDNSFGDVCRYNSFDNGGYYNSFGNNCYYNSFGNNCYYNSLGNECNDNSFGNSCSHNSFRLAPSNRETLKDYCYYNHFDDGCCHNVIWNSNTTGSANKLQNINVNRGVSGTTSNYNFINIYTLNADYETQVAKNSKGEIKIYCEADLIA